MAQLVDEAGCLNTPDTLETLFSMMLGTEEKYKSCFDFHAEDGHDTDSDHTSQCASSSSSLLETEHFGYAPDSAGTSKNATTFLATNR
jgi:hypothetical protein